MKKVRTLIIIRITFESTIKLQSFYFLLFFIKLNAKRPEEVKAGDRGIFILT